MAGDLRLHEHEVEHVVEHVTYIIGAHWRHNERGSISNHRHLDCLLNHLLRSWSKKTSKLRFTGLCEGNSPLIGEFPAQRASKKKMFQFDDVTMLTDLEPRA